MADSTSLKHIRAVYEKFKHLNPVLGDTEIMSCDNDRTKDCCHELWQAIKADLGEEA